MKKGLLLTFLLALTCLAGGSVAAMAQTPEPTAKWIFDNAEDLMAPSVGNLTLTPCVIPGNKSIADSNVSDAGIVPADGPTEDVAAIAVPKASALKVSRAEGAETSTAYTILMDIMVTDPQPFNGLLQMDEANANDGDLFINKGQVGIGSIKYAGKIEANKWYRVVFTYNTENENGKARIYLNGEKIAEGGENQRHIMQPFGFYVLCDEDGEKIDLTYISQVAFWETPLTDEEVAEMGNAIPAHEHNFVDFFCTICDMFQTDYLTPNANGYYEIASAKDLSWFELKVNRGEFTANAILTDDIDMANDGAEIDWTPIGDWGNTRGVPGACYQGHFDGQGHAIRNLNATSKQNFFGLFGVISSNSIIENFDIYGTYNVRTQYAGGVAAYARDTNPTIRNVHSYVNINNTSAGGRQGGILGGAMVDNANWKTTIENCIYSGTLDGNDAGGGGNYGGMVGYANSNSNNIVDIVNCLFDGEVLNLNPVPGGCTFGGIVGYCNTGRANIKNCLSIGTVNAAEKKFGQFFGCLNGNNSTFTNCYYMGEFVNGAAGVGTASGETPALLEKEQLENGEACWLLNGETFVDVAWQQELGEQDYPTPYGSEGVVYYTLDGYDCIDFDNFSGFRDAIIAAETAYVEDEELAAYHEYLEAYKTSIESWKGISTFEEFFEAYKAADEQRNALKASAAKYEEYKEACEAAATYIEDNHLEGDKTDILLAYLEDNLEPSSETYPNGSYPYIIEHGNLDNEGIDAEISFVRTMLDLAIAADGIVSGVEVSRFFTNTTFANGFEGWQTENEEGMKLDTGGVLEVMPLVHGYGKGAFSVSQTVKGLPNGIYMTTTNALFSPNDNPQLSFYAGQVFINNTVNYVMAPGEDLIPEDQAVDLVNCMLSQDKLYDGEFGIGYVPNTRNACSYAFNSGRYKNYCAAEVTDGSLTVGVRALGTGMALDWLPFNDMHIVYLGTADEANTYLTDVLKAYCERAQTILNFTWDEYEYATYPNMSEDLKSQLIGAVSAADKATTGADKMTVINTFSGLFNEVFACRKAYIEMATAANVLYDFINTLADNGLISAESDEYLYWDNEIYAALDHYREGDVSAAQAQEIADALNNCDLRLTPVDGVYQLATVKDLILFQMIVNDGNDKADAVLTADIDLGELIPEEGAELSWTPIGNWGQNGKGVNSAAYRGHFDGQGHTIKNLNATSNQNFFGLFGVLSNGAVIENFTIDGNINATVQYVGGAAGFARDTEVVIRNIHSYVNISNTLAGARQGGVLGTANNGTTTVENCTYSGTLDGNDAGGGGNYGGIIGYINNSAAAIATINNCLFDGEVVNNNETPGSCTFGGIIGYNNSGTVTIKNCLSIGTVRSARYSQFFGAINGNNSTFENNYYVGDNVNGSGSGGTVAGPVPVKVTKYELANGEICFKLNAGQTETNWYQTINEDDYPVLNTGHETVLFNEAEGYFYNLVDGVPVGVKDVERSLTTDQSIYKQGSTIVNLAGQRLSKLQKGINIVNSKKVLVK